MVGKGLWDFVDRFLLYSGMHILLAAIAYSYVIADNDFMNNPLNFIYSRILLMLIFLVCASTMILYAHSMSLNTYWEDPRSFQMPKKTWKIEFRKSTLTIFFSKACLSQWTSKAKTKIRDKCAIKRKIRRERQREKKGEKSVGKSQPPPQNKSTRILLDNVTSVPCPLTLWWK